MNSRDVLTYLEAAQLARLSPRTLSRLVHQGLLPVVRVGRSVRIRRESLLEFLERAEVLA